MRTRTTVLAVALVLAACGGGEVDDTTATDPGETMSPESPETTTAPEPTDPPETTTTTAPPAEGAIPDPVAGATLVGDPATDITAGDVFVYWYRDTASGNYVVLYAGPGIAGSTGQALCPGNSIAAPDFMHVSNTPVEDGSCVDFPTVQASIQLCTGDVWLYRTLIPGDLEGTLYGSLEWNAGDGSIQGKYSQFETSNDIGEFEYGLGSYDLWFGFTSDESSTITCDAPKP